ncbi:MAG: hypothetical protein RLZZ430_527 [Cyanobacteriota bacterium]|jgi:hypothetical protein
MTPGLETDSEQNGEPHSRGFHPVAELTGLSIGFAAILLPICCVLADQILPLPTNQVIIGDAAPQPLRTEAPEIPGLDR